MYHDWIWLLLSGDGNKPFKLHCIVNGWWQPPIHCLPISLVIKHHKNKHCKKNKNKHTSNMWHVLCFELFVSLVSKQLLLLGRNEYLLLLCLYLHSLVCYLHRMCFFNWVFPQLCPGSLIISTDLNHYLSKGLTALSVNISMQTNVRHIEWSYNTQSYKDIVTITAIVWSRFHISFISAIMAFLT